MLYDIRLQLHYDYNGLVRGDRHHVRVLPRTIPGVQRVIAAALSFDPLPTSRSGFVDFFGNQVASVAFRNYHDQLEVRLSARIGVEERPLSADLSPAPAEMGEELAQVLDLGADSPQHFLGPSPRVPLNPAITSYTQAILAGAGSVQAAALALCKAIHRDFAYDSSATAVDTSPEEAFALRRGVCQDFVHVMLAGLRGSGIPAAYVSGLLRTVPPSGLQRLEGADAMHAWVRVWCGRHAGWIDFDPTNAVLAGADHITIGYGRDYSDISPILGVLRTSSTHATSQSVDVASID